MSPVRSGSPIQPPGPGQQLPRHPGAPELPSRTGCGADEAAGDNNPGSTREHQVRVVRLQPVPGDHLAELRGAIIRELEVGPEAALTAARVQVFVHQGQAQVPRARAGGRVPRLGGRVEAGQEAQGEVGPLRWQIVQVLPAAGGGRGGAGPGRGCW